MSTERERYTCPHCGVEIDNGADRDGLCGKCYRDAHPLAITGTLNGQPVKVSADTVAKIERELKVAPVGVEESTIEILRARLTKAEDALTRVLRIDARGAVDAGKTWQERRDVAWNALERAKVIAREGLCS